MMAISEETVKNLGAECMEKKVIGDKSKDKGKKTVKCRREVMDSYEMYKNMKRGVKKVTEDVYDLEGYEFEIPSVDYAEGAEVVASLILELLDDKWKGCDEKIENYSLDGDELGCLYSLMEEIRDMAVKRRRIRLVNGLGMPAMRIFDHTVPGA